MEIPELTLKSLAWIIAALGAINWGMQEIGTNLVTEVLPNSAGAVYLAIGVAGALALSDEFGVLDLEDMG